ncbi:class I SAM-dependent methyltransferase [Pseudonocardia alni]|uniref:class I SAM-dependent methyltransferase n=1 Tax=Pseudonocardia alni TaxID=33907 RepID=UPI0033E28D8F
MKLRSLVVEGPSSLGGRARARRWELFRDALGDVSDLSVLDLGGTPSTWQRAPVRPRSVTVLNLFPGELNLRDNERPDLEGIEVVHGDACQPPSEIANRRFDLVFSNSLIEHVGGPYRRRQLAEVIRSAADRYWVQTPYRYFPVEPHWIFPGFQFLPLAARARLSQTWPLVHSRATSRADGIDASLDVELISLTEMRHLFPGGAVKIERFGGIPKSLIAVRT